MVMDTLALAVSATANYVLRHREAQRMMLPLVAFPICGLGDLFCIYHELKAVQLRTLNRERGEMIAEKWLEEKQVGGGDWVVSYSTSLKLTLGRRRREGLMELRWGNLGRGGAPCRQGNGGQMGRGSRVGRGETGWRRRRSG